MTKQLEKDLKAVYRMIRREENWCQGAFARRADGSACMPDSFEAVQFCLLGAVRRVTGRALSEAEQHLTAEIGPYFTVFNDNNSHQAVKQRLKEIVKKVKTAKAAEGSGETS